MIPATTALLSGCTSLPENVNRIESRAIDDTRDTALGNAITTFHTDNPGKDGFLLLDNGLDAFVARAVLAEKAELSLDVQYYLYHGDLVGRLFTAILWRAAERGVRVRLLIDDMDMAGRDAGIIAFDSHPNIEVRIFNPFSRSIGRIPQFVGGLGTLTRRMHNKSFTADNAMTIVGGRNIGDEYFDADPALAFTDLDIMAGGSVAKDVSNAFDTYWNNPLAYPATTVIKARPANEAIQSRISELPAFAEQQRDSGYMMALAGSDLARKLRSQAVYLAPGTATVVVDHPDKIRNTRDASDLHLVPQLAPWFRKVDQDLIVISPYFVPGSQGVDFFRKLVERGVRVRILTNSLASNDVGMVHAGYSKYRKALLRAGVELYEMKSKQAGKEGAVKSNIGSTSKASLHAKTFILDQQRVFIGSLNLDPRSFYENTEIGLVVDSPDIVESMTDRFNRNIEKNTFRVMISFDETGAERLGWHGYENGKPVRYSVEPDTGFWQRLGTGLLRLLPVESQL